MRWLFKRRIDCVSRVWIAEQQRKSSRIDYQGVRWKFPVRKVLNEAGSFNRQKLKRSA